MVGSADLAPGDVISVTGAGADGGLILSRVTLVKHQSGRLWLVDADGVQDTRKISNPAVVVGGSKLAAAQQDSSLVMKTGPAYTWVGSEGVG